MKVIIGIPAYNEAKNIASIILKLKRDLESGKKEQEIIAWIMFRSKMQQKFFVK